MSLRDEIITSESANRMLERVSPIYDESYVGLWIFEAIGREYDSLWEIVRSLPQQLFPETVTWAIELWERRYDITPSPSQTLEQRRQKIIALSSTPKPMTPYRIESYISAMYGRDCEAVDNVAPYTFGVYIISNGDNPTEVSIQDVQRYLDKHKPSHLSYQLGFGAGTKINIGRQTGYWMFEYPFAGTGIYAGSYPHTSTLGAVASGSIHAGAAAQGFKIEYPMTGTLPDINTLAGIESQTIDALAGSIVFKFDYEQSGSSDCGTLPDLAFTSTSDGESIRASPDGKGYTIDYPFCGTASAGEL